MNDFSAFIRRFSEAVVLIAVFAYFPGWIYRYTYYYEFGIQTVIFEMPFESFFFVTFNILLAPIANTFITLGSNIFNENSEVPFLNLGIQEIIVPLTLLLVCLVLRVIYVLLKRILKILKEAASNLGLTNNFKKESYKGNNSLVKFMNPIVDFLADVFKPFNIIFSQVPILLIAVLFVLYCTTLVQAKIAARNDKLTIQSKLPYISIVSNNSKSEESSFGSYLGCNDNGEHNIKCVGKCASRDFKGSLLCSQYSDWRLLLRLNSRLYVVKTVSSVKDNFVGTFIMEKNENNHNDLIVITPFIPTKN